MAKGDVEQSTETEREVLPPDGLQFQAATTTLEAQEQTRGYDVFFNKL